MSRKAKVLGYAAFTVMALIGLLGAAFVAGEAFDDPGGWAAVGMTTLWLLPLLGLITVAVRLRESAGPVFAYATALVVLFTLADSAFGIIPRDDWGPVAAIVVFALGVALAFLGLYRPSLAGLLMMVLGLAQLAAGLIGAAVRATDHPGPGAGLGGSSGVVIVPILLVGLLFMLAGSPSHSASSQGQRIDAPDDDQTYRR